jgi:hypothetical protein
VNALHNLFEGFLVEMRRDATHHHLEGGAGAKGDSRVGLGRGGSIEDCLRVWFCFGSCRSCESILLSFGRLSTEDSDLKDQLTPCQLLSLEFLDSGDGVLRKGTGQDRSPHEVEEEGPAKVNSQFNKPKTFGNFALLSDAGSLDRSALLKQCNQVLEKNISQASQGEGFH